MKYNRLAIHLNGAIQADALFDSLRAMNVRLGIGCEHIVHASDMQSLERINVYVADDCLEDAMDQCRYHAARADVRRTMIDWFFIREQPLLPS